MPRSSSLLEKRLSRPAAATGKTLDLCSAVSGSGAAISESSRCGKAFAFRRRRLYQRRINRARSKRAASPASPPTTPPTTCAVRVALASSALLPPPLPDSDEEGSDPGAAPASGEPAPTRTDVEAAPEEAEEARKLDSSAPVADRDTELGFFVARVFEVRSSVRKVLEVRASRSMTVTPIEVVEPSKKVNAMEDQHVESGGFHTETYWMLLGCADRQPLAMHPRRQGLLRPRPSLQGEDPMMVKR